MKIGIMSGAYLGRYGLEKGAEKMAAHGYEAIDFQDFCNTESTLFSCTESEFETKLKRTRAVLEANRIEIFQAHGPWRYPMQDFTAELRAERFEKMAKSIRGCAILGCKYMVIHNLMPYGNYDLNADVVLDINSTFMTKLAQIGQAYGVTVCMENMPFLHQHLSTPAALLAFVKELDSPFLRLCLDTGHCSVHNLSPAEAVRQWGTAYLHTLHIHDNNGKHDQHLPPYMGVIDWADFSAALQEIGYNGVLSLETAVSHTVTENREQAEISLAQSALRLAGR